jgi:hypothetical protein
MTHEEAVDSLKMLIKVAKRGSLKAEEIRISVDNAHCNVSIDDVEDEQLGNMQHVVNPKHSPDFQKPVEHAIGFIKRGVRRRLALEPRERTPEELQELVRSVAYNLPAASIAKDVHSLPLTYAVVAAKKGSVFTGADGKQHTGVEGGWPPARYR